MELVTYVMYLIQDDVFFMGFWTSTIGYWTTVAAYSVPWLLALLQITIQLPIGYSLQRGDEFWNNSITLVIIGVLSWLMTGIIHIIWAPVYSHYVEHVWEAHICTTVCGRLSPDLNEA